MTALSSATHHSAKPSVKTAVSVKARPARQKPARAAAAVAPEAKAAPAAAKKTAKEAAPREEPVNRIRIKIRAYDHRIIDQATRTIVETAERHDAKVVGPVPLPTEKVKITVNRSTFVHKNAREQFEMRVHKRLVDIFNANPKCLDALMSLQLPAGVDVEVKM